MLQRMLETSEEQQLERPSHACDELPGRFLACVRTAESASRLESRFAAYAVADDIANPQKQEQRKPYVQVPFGAGCNVEAVRHSTAVILACQPSQVADVVAEQGMADALRGILVLNICAGITDAVLWGSSPPCCRASRPGPRRRESPIRFKQIGATRQHETLYAFAVFSVYKQLARFGS